MNKYEKYLSYMNKQYNCFQDNEIAVIVLTNKFKRLNKIEAREIVEKWLRGVVRET